MKALALLCLALMLSLVCSKQLVMIQQTFRHGARYPLFVHDIDGSRVFETSDLMGELTNEGKNMHYLLGKLLYSKYWMLLFKGTQYENAYSQAQIYAKSTDYNRTIESAESQLFGWLENLPPLYVKKENYGSSLPSWAGYEQQKIVDNATENVEVFQSASVYHPVAIHSQKRGASVCDDGDYLTKYDEDSCPNQKYWQAENQNSDEYVHTMRHPKVKEAIQALSQAVGQEIEFENVYEWTDTDTSLQFLGMERLPIMIDPKHAPILRFIEVYTMYQKYYSQTDQIRAVSTNYFAQTLARFQSHIAGESAPKIVLLSGHDTTLGMVLTAMNFVSPQCIKDHYLNAVENDDTCIWQYPRYSSNIIFELWNNNGEYSVRVLYNGEVKKIPVCGYKTECSFDQFKAWVQSFVVADFNSACGYVPKNKVFYAVVLILSSAIAALAIYVCFLHAKIRKIDTVARAKHEGYIQNFEEKESKH